MRPPEYVFTDGVESVTLDGTDGSVLSDGYTLITPALRQVVATAAGADGGELSADYDNVADTLAASLTGGTDTVIANVQRLNRLFERARRYARPGVLPVYLKFRRDSSQAWVRSQILSGRALYAKDALNTEALAGAFTVTCIFTRRFYWEADAEVELPLIAVGDTAPGVTGSRQIFNNAGDPIAIASSTNANPIVITTASPHKLATGQYVNVSGHLLNTSANGNRYITVTGGSTFSLDGSRGTAVGGATGQIQLVGNYVDIAAGQVVGDIPAPAHVELVVVTGSIMGRVYLAQELSNGLAPLISLLQAEDATGGSSLGAVATLSAGSGKSFTWAGAAEYDALSWAIASAAQRSAGGRMLRVMARFASTFAYTDLYLRVKLLVGTTLLYQAEKQGMLAGRILQEVCTIPLPPQLGMFGAPAAISLVLQASRPSAAAINIASSTNANPIKITTVSAHGLTTGASVLIASHLVNTNANGTWVITYVDATSFTLATSTGNGVGVMTGTEAPYTLVALDTLALLPLDGWRKLTTNGPGAPFGGYVDDNGVEGLVYSSDGTYVSPDWLSEGDPIMLRPAPALGQRLRFMWARTDYTMPITDSLTVRVWYRPRRLTI